MSESFTHLLNLQRELAKHAIIYPSIYLMYTSIESWLNLQSRTSTSIRWLSADFKEGSWLVDSELAVATGIMKCTQKPKW